MFADEMGVSPGGTREYREATLYYAERDPRLVLRFVQAVEDAIRQILEAQSVGAS